MGNSRAGRLSREPRRTSEAASTTIPRSIFGAGQDGLLNLQRTAGNQAVARPRRHGRVAASDLSPVAAEQSSLPAPPSHSLGNQAFLPLMAGAATPPEVIAHSHRDESAANALASAIMHMADQGGQPAAARTALSGRLDPDTRGFFESRFGVDLSDVRVHANPEAARSAARLGAAAYTVGTDIVMGAGQQAGPNLLTAHELAHVVRGDAVGRLCRAPGGSGGFTIISRVWRVADRDIVLVATGYGNQVMSFYRRTGLGSKGVGIAPRAEQWVPFKTLMEHEDLAGTAWFNKRPYYTTVGPEDPLRGYGNTRNKEVGTWLDGEQIPAGAEAESWERVEQEMDQVAGRYRGSTRGGGAPGGGSGPGGSAEPKAGSAEAKGAGTEAKAIGAEAEAANKTVGTEAKVLGVEAKALKDEGTILKVAVDVAKAGRAARLGALLLELGLPGPWDVFFLFLSAFASMAEAKTKLKAEAYARGFAQGLAAVLTGTSASETTRLLMFKVATPSIGERVAGFEGVRERGTNEGVAAGFKFGRALNYEQRQGFLDKCFKDIKAPPAPREGSQDADVDTAVLGAAVWSGANVFKARSHQITGDFGRDDLIEMGISLQPTVIELLEEAQRQFEEAQRRKEIARMAGSRSLH